MIAILKNIEKLESYEYFAKKTNNQNRCLKPKVSLLVHSDRVLNPYLLTSDGLESLETKKLVEVINYLVLRQIFVLGLPVLLEEKQILWFVIISPLVKNNKLFSVVYKMLPWYTKLYLRKKKWFGEILKITL